MKQILITLTILIFLSCQKQQDKYLITGTLKNIPDSTLIDLFIQYDAMSNRIKTDTIINGLFEFTDTLENRPAKMNLRIRDYQNFYGSCDLWVDYEEIHVKGKGKYLSSWTASSNVKEQIALNKLHSKTKKLDIMTDSLLLLRMNNWEDRELSNLIKEKIDSIYQITRGIEFELIKQDPNSQSALEMLYKTAKYDTLISKKQISEVYNKLDIIYKNTLYGEGIVSILEDKTVPEIGDKMVDVVVYDLEGKKHRLTDYQGKYILLDFWSMACYPCVLAAPELRELSFKYQDNLTIIGLNMETKREMWEKGTKRDSITWVNLSDGKGTFAGASATYGINGFPTYILINPEGVIVEKWMGFWKGVFKNKLSKHIVEIKS